MAYLAHHGVEVMIEEDGGYTPTPVTSYAILTYVSMKGHLHRGLVPQAYPPSSLSGIIPS